MNKHDAIIALHKFDDDSTFTGDEDPQLSERSSTWSYASTGDAEGFCQDLTGDDLEVENGIPNQDFNWWNPIYLYGSKKT